MDKVFLQKLHSVHEACPSCPSQDEVANFFNSLLGALFPDYSRVRFPSLEAFEHHVQKLQGELTKILSSDLSGTNGEEAAARLFDKLPLIYEKIDQDITAMYEGDPAARSRSEVVRAYPGFYAIAAYRIAHELHLEGVEVIPRLITELAHSKTGIDIHPAAEIGRYFCIDHGTGIVIGETTVIGDQVKIYQGVTLGALSVSKEDASKKRHPTIEDRVVIYAGATILGGETVIGHDSTIGGNVWLTRSVPPYSKIYYQARMHHDSSGDYDVFVYRVK